MANNELQTSPLASTTLEAWATTPSTWRENSVIEFRVRRSGQPTRRLRLPGARYTFGNGSACSIQLEDASLRPLHAVLIRDKERILVRAYSVPFQINNHRVSEGLLSTGDRLRLGEYELELLDVTSHSATPICNASAFANCEGAGAVDAEECSDAQSRSFHEEAKQWRALKLDTQRREAWCESRERELKGSQAELEQRMGMLQKREEELQLQESAAVEVHDEFRNHYQELLQHRDELTLQHEELASGREHLRLQQERLDGRDRLHRQQIDKLIGEQEQFKKVETLSQQKLAESEGQLNASRQQAEAATSAVAQMRDKFALLSEQLTQLSEHQASLKQLEAQRADEHEHRTDQLELARDEALAHRDYVAAQRDNLTTQRDVVTAQRDDLAIQRDDIAAERDDIAIERDEIAACCRELEMIQDQLRAEIEQLQSEIATTRLHAESLDQECQAARHTIASLEDTVRDQDDRYEIDRQSWTDEIDALCKNIDALSLDLETAQSQLTQLRDDNLLLAEHLTGVTDQRDQARAERAVAIEQCKAAQHDCQVAQAACDSARMDCESARRDLETARLEVKLAREERDVAAAHRDQILAQRDAQIAKHDELICDQAGWVEQKSQAERRYQETRSHLADAREKCERAVRARDEAESARLAAEEQLTIATAELQAMQAERDEAIADQETLRRQRDSAIQDAKDTRELFDRCNREHDDTLELIERLEQKTREVMGDFVPDHSSPEPVRLSLLDEGMESSINRDEPTVKFPEKDISEQNIATQNIPEQREVNERFDADDVWPTYSIKEKESVGTPEPASPSSEESAVTSDESVEAVLAPRCEPATEPTLCIVATSDEATDRECDADRDPVAAEDDSIEAYMNRLLQRVQGRITDAVPLAAGAEQEDEQEQEQEQKQEQSNMPMAMESGIAAMPPETVQTDKLPKLPPKVKKNPPKVQPTAAKRSNTPKRESVSRKSKSNGKAWSSRAMMKYAQMGIALLCGMVAVVLVSLPMLKIVAAVAALLIAAISAKEARAIQSELASPRSLRRTPSTTDTVMPKAAA